MPAEAVAVTRVLRLEILRAVLADDLDSRLRERLELVDRDVLRRGDDGHPRADLFLDALVPLADLVRRHARALPARPSACRRGGARRRGRATRRAEVEAVDARHARVAQRELGRAPEVELSVRTMSSPNRARNGSPTSSPHLVAARPDRRADRGGERTAAERLHRGLDDAVEQTAPAGVHDRDRRRSAARARERDRQAVGAHREDREVALLRPEPVAASRRANLRARDGRASSGTGSSVRAARHRRRSPRTHDAGSRRRGRRRRRCDGRGSATRTARRSRRRRAS